MPPKDWNIEALTGYKPKTTFYTDFSIADGFGVSAIRDTYHRAFAAWHDNVEYLTELVMVLNWKAWEYYNENETYTQVYQDLWELADTYATDSLAGDDLTYFLQTTD